MKGVGGAVVEGEQKRPSYRQQKRTFTGALPASWPWDLLYFKGWRLAVGGWRLLAVGGCWRLAVVGGCWRLVVGSWRPLGAVLSKQKNNLAS